MSANIDRIRKLLAKAGDPRNNEHEADAARRIAQAMMDAAGLAEADVGALGEEEAEPWKTVGDDVAFRTRSSHKPPAWQVAILSALARVTGCYGYWSWSEGVCTLHIIGTDDARVRFRELAAWMWRQIDLMVAGARRSYAHRPRAALFAYRLGLANSISKSALALVAARDAAPVSSTALAVRDKVAEAIRAATPGDVAKSKARTVYYRAADAYEAGKVDGRAVEMQRRAAAPAERPALATGLRLGGGS